jgi:5'(3')-deoxyribonucleotidase
MKRIAVDMDEVVADVLPKFLNLFEQHNGWRPSEADYQGKKLYALPGGEGLRQALYQKGFFLDLPLIPGAQEGIQHLLQEGHEIFFVTAAQEFRNSLEDKYDWLLQYFPNISWKNFVFCGDKSIICADYLIDDHAFNLRTFKGKGLLFSAPHNMLETEFTRVNNWAEVLAFFEQEKHKHAARF